MATFILILFGLAIVHFVYESVVAPTIRLRLRFRLFELRDELRQLKIDDPDRVPDEVFLMVQDNLNTAITLVPRTDFVLLRAFYGAMKDDASFRIKVDERLARLDRCVSGDLQAIRRKAADVFVCAFATNTALLLVLAVPFWLLVLPWSLVSRVVDNLLSMPADRVEDVVLKAA